MLAVVGSSLELKQEHLTTDNKSLLHSDDHFTFNYCVCSDLERVLNINLGQEEEFSPLQGQCFEYTDRE